MFDLPEVARYKLERPPLVQALVQVRFPVLAHLGTVTGIARLQDALSSHLPYMEPASSAMTVQVGPGGAAIEQGPQDGWQLSNDQGYRLVLTPGAANLVIDSAYQGVTPFAELLEHVLSVLAETEPIRRCDRIGARYLSKVTPRAEEAWTTWFKQELTGWAASGVLKAELEAAANRVQVRGNDSEYSDVFPAAPRGLITSGWFPAGSLISGLPPLIVQEPSFVVDFDFFSEGPQPFSASSLVRQYRALHDQMDRFFRWSLTTEGETYFGLEEK